MEKGCSPFFFTSALMSIVMGEMNMNGQLDQCDSNIIFKKELAKLREQNDDMLLELDIAHNKKNIEQGRIYQIEQSSKEFESIRKLQEFNFFQKQCWPLIEDIGNIIFANHTESYIQPLTVIVAKSNSAILNSDYNDYCANHHRDSKPLAVKTYNSGVWNRDYTGGIAQGLNVHYIMQGIPTLLIMPYVINNTIQFNTCMWSFSKRGLASFNHTTMLTLPFDEKEYKMTNYFSLKIQKALFLITGVVRDAYMLNEYQSPTLLPNLIQDEIISYSKEFQDFISLQYKAMINQVQTPVFKSICKDQENINSIHQSLTIPEFNKLLIV